MLWLCIQLPRLALEAAAGAAPAASRQTQLEQAALRQLALWAHQWSSQVACQHPLDPADNPGGEARLWIEIGASLELFGGRAHLQQLIGTALSTLGYSGALASAPTPQGAALLARAASATSAATLAELQRVLAPLALRFPALPAVQLSALHTAGLRRIGELLALPAAAVGRRFGADTLLYLKRLTGTAPDPLPTITPPARFESTQELAGAVTDATALLFPLRRLLGELQGFLRARDQAVQQCTLKLLHHRGTPTLISVGLSQPGRDAAQLLGLLRERLDQCALRSPVLAMGLVAHELLAPYVLQTDAFSQSAEQAAQFHGVLDRLAARLGDMAVQSLRPQADHRPERAWHSVPGTDSSSTALPANSLARPCWLLAKPRSIAAPAELLAGPERIESGWWDGADVARDYYLACDDSGARLWVFRDLRSGAWFVQGLWA
jgi:protein ImuB